MNEVMYFFVKVKTVVWRIPRQVDFERYLNSIELKANHLYCLILNVLNPKDTTDTRGCFFELLDAALVRYKNK